VILAVAKAGNSSCQAGNQGGRRFKLLKTNDKLPLAWDTRRTIVKKADSRSGPTPWLRARLRGPSGALNGRALND
jgi:hypothetical protein